MNVLVFLVESDTAKDSAIEELQKQINDIVQELNLLKEQQAPQADNRCVFTEDSPPLRHGMI